MIYAKRADRLEGNRFEGEEGCAEAQVIHLPGLSGNAGRSGSGPHEVAGTRGTDHVGELHTGSDMPELPRHWHNLSRRQKHYTSSEFSVCDTHLPPAADKVRVIGALEPYCDYPEVSEEVRGLRKEVRHRSGEPQ